MYRYVIQQSKAKEKVKKNDITHFNSSVQAISFLKLNRLPLAQLGPLIVFRASQESSDL